MKYSNIKTGIRTMLIFVLILTLALPVRAATVMYDNGTLKAKFTEIKVDTENNDTTVSEDEGEEDWTDWIDEEDTPIGGNITISTEFSPVKVAENNLYILWYDEIGADIYLYDKNSGDIWSNTVDDSYYQNEKADVAMLTQLLSVSVADKDNEITLCDLCDSVGNANQFSLFPEYEDDKLKLKIEMINFDISFGLHFGIDDSGITVTIPSSEIKQKSKNRIVSITVMPYFAATKIQEQGYLLIPDGSGELIDFDNKAQKEDRVYHFQLYGLATQNVDTLVKRDEHDIKNLMLPLFGISRQKNGLLASVTAGAENTSLNVVPHGYQASGLARAYFTFNYIYTEKVNINGVDFERLMPTQELTDREIKYFILKENAKDYSSMAAVYRSYLEEKGILKNKIKLDEPVVSLDILMGVNKAGLFREKYLKMTTIEDLEEIIKDLTKAGVKAEVTLQGWNTGGFTEFPTPSGVASGLGGKSKLIDFTEWAKKKGIPVYLYNNFIEGNTDSKNINLKKDVIRDYVGNIISGVGRGSVVMNMNDTFLRQIGTARKTKMYENAAFSLARVGQWLWNNYDKDNPSTRTETLNACIKALENTKKAEGSLQVYGGNQYVLPFADSIREIPDTNSGYYFTTRSVPFYQMVISGYARYTSIAANMSYDLEYQKLKWLEYGSSPYYVITKENAINLVESDYDKLFSSEYSVWGEQIKALYKTYKTDLANISGAEMIKHSYITDTLVCVEYNNNTAVYINYGNETATVDEISVPAKSYKTLSFRKGAEK